MVRQKGTGMKLTILGGALRENCPHPNVRIIHLNSKLLLTVRLDEDECSSKKKKKNQ